jgi:microcystin-dependent protein
MPKKHMHADRARSALRSALAGACVAWAALAVPQAAHAGDPFLGEVICGGWNFCPVGWAECNGQLMSIAQNSALFTLLGTTYGGDGQTTFGLPNLQSRTVIGDGQGPGLTNRTQGETGGAETVTITSNTMPTHTHSLTAHDGAEKSASPTGKIMGASPATAKAYSSQATNVQLRPNAMSIVGGSQPHPNLQPYLAVKCCIAVNGIFPSQ